MNEIKLKKQSVNKKSLVLIFMVLFSLVIYENGFFLDFNIRNYVQIYKNNRKQPKTGFEIRVLGYDYSLGRNRHKFLQHCTFEVSVDKVIYTKIMDLNIRQQTRSNYTTVYFNNKLDNASIHFSEYIKLPNQHTGLWPEELKKEMKVLVPNTGTGAILDRATASNIDYFF